MIVDDPVFIGSGLFRTPEFAFLGSIGAKAPCASRAFVEIPLPLGPASCETFGSFARGSCKAPLLTGATRVLFLLGRGGGLGKAGTEEVELGGGAMAEAEAEMVAGAATAVLPSMSLRLVSIWLPESENNEFGESGLA